MDQAGVFQANGVLVDNYYIIEDTGNNATHEKLQDDLMHAPSPPSLDFLNDLPKDLIASAKKYYTGVGGDIDFRDDFFDQTANTTTSALQVSLETYRGLVTV